MSDERQPGWWRKLLGPGRFAALVVILLLAASTGYLGARAFALSGQATALADERAQALSDASRFAVDLTSYDYRNLNAAFDAVVADSTAAFGAQYRTTSQAKAAQLRADRSVSRGTVVAAGIADETPGRSADVLVLVNQSITNTANPTPTTQRGELRLTLVRSDNRWLLSDLTLL
jgi:Mce-associated membrane protein